MFTAKNDAPTGASLSLHGLAPPVTLDIHLEDCGVMDEAIEYWS
jgi:hypothetical protein